MNKDKSERSYYVSFYGVWKQASVQVEEIKTPGKRYF